MYSAFYKLLPTEKDIADENVHLLNDQEIKYIKKTEKNAILISALIGGMMVIILYAPQYKLTHLFSTTEYTIPYLNQRIQISFISLLYGIFLVFAELFLLTLLNIYCTHEVALLSGFIDKNNKLSHEKKDFLLNISHQKKNKEIHKLGINPYLGLNKTTVFLMNLFFTLKATLSNFLIRILFQRLLGRYAIRLILDLLGIPVFAFWNAMGTAKILKESRIIIMGVNYLKHFEKELQSFRQLTELEKSLLYDTLQYIAVSKRDYHKNHFVLSKIVIDHFSITTEKLHKISENYGTQIRSCSNDFKMLNEKILIPGIVLDGSVSFRESNRIKKLHSMQVLTSNQNKIKNIAKEFMYGKGIDI